jgi:formylglycine-generating enzyme required for sulfatase activity
VPVAPPADAETASHDEHRSTLEVTSLPRTPPPPPPLGGKAWLIVAALAGTALLLAGLVAWSLLPRRPADTGQAKGTAPARDAVLEELEKLAYDADRAAAAGDADALKLALAALSAFHARHTEAGNPAHRQAAAEALATIKRRTPTAPEVPQPTPSDWRPLFNGKDLTGWKVHPDGKAEWKVENGVLVSGGPKGYLFTERGDWRNFRLRVELKLSAAGNSGLFLRCPFRPEPSGGYEVQLANGDAQRNGGLERFRPGEESLAWGTGPVVPPDTWFTVEVALEGERVVTRINGEVVVDVVDAGTPWASGHIALQHNQGTVAQFRRVEVQESVAPVVAPFDAPQAQEQQRRWAAHLNRQPVETNSIGMRLALIPPGEFLMGEDDPSFPTSAPRHPVRITRPFLIGVCEVTQAEYEKVMGANPAHFREGNGGGPDHPVESISHDDALAFCRRLSELPQEKKAGRLYRLPTEAEWEHAARAGADTPYVFGTGLTPKLARVASLGTVPVGSYPANAWGLHDVHGNVEEFCADWYDPDYYKSSPRDDPAGPPAGGPNRVRRSNSYQCTLKGAMIARRQGADGVPSKRGFRVVCEIDPKAGGFVSLFNGTNLDGWEVKSGGADAWLVRDGVLVCKGTQHGWLGTTRKYRDFVLRLEWRVAPGANSGVFLRVPDGPGEPWQRGGSEVQIVDDHAPGGDTAADRQSGAIYAAAARSRSVFKGAGQWNQFEITCKGSQITVVFNGEKVLDVDSAQVPALARRSREGVLGLQSWKGEVEFRHIAIKELADAPAGAWRPLFDGPGLKGWGGCRNTGATRRAS